MQISQAGIDLIRSFEGLKYDAYLDAVGVPTIGYGHTRDVKMGDKVDDIGAMIFLMDDIAVSKKDVDRLVTVLLTQGQFDALVSFAFNLGGGNLASSTLLRKLNVDDYSGAADEFGRWVYAGKTKLAGLVRRREAERKLFLG